MTAVTENDKEELRREYKRKMLEDTERIKKTRIARVKQQQVEDNSNPVFDYGEIIVTEKIKV